MKVLVLYRPESEHSRLVEEYIHEFNYRHPDIKLTTVNIDTRDGAALASLYDVVRYPSLIVTTDDGVIQRCWMGDVLPLMDEVLSYARV